MNVTKNIENSDLRVFATVVRKASFVAAAEELSMSPAYVSKRIGMLEQALGVRLFHRTTRRVVVSEDGEQVYARTLAILASLDGLFDELAGAGIVLRSRWDAQAYLDRDQLVQILPAYTQEANVWAVYPQRLAGSAKVRVFVDFLERHLACDNPGSANQMPRL